MGLDITAYSKLTRLDVRDEEGTPVDAQTGQEVEVPYCFVYNESEFLDRAATLTVGGYYAYVQKMGFRAGGYSAYSVWRNLLAKVAGYRPFGGRYDEGAWGSTHGPFWELIYFTDCDGTIDSVVAAKLVRDFAEYEPKARAEGPEFYLMYTFWQKAFVLASDGGAVRFH